MSSDNNRDQTVQPEDSHASRNAEVVSDLAQLYQSGPQTRATYSDNELPTEKAIKADKARNQAFSGVMNAAANAIPLGKSAVDVANTVNDMNNRSALNLPGGALGAVGEGDVLVATVTSKRESFWGKIGGGLKWVFSKVSNFFSSLIPGGSFVSDGVQVGLEVGLNSFKNSEQASYRRETGQRLYFADRDDLEEIFHTDQEEILNSIASVLDANRDGEVDMLELSTAQTLLDQDRSGDVSAEEIQAHGGLQGAMAYLNHHHKDAVDRIEYDETFGKYNLLRTLGSSSEARETIGNRFMELDKDKDGKVSRDEYREALEGLDMNGDRVIDRNERKAIQDDPNAAFNLMVQRLNNSGR